MKGIHNIPVLLVNSDAIKKMTLNIGGMPAQYGGRLSSVLDVRMNYGNNQDFDVRGEIGLAATKVECRRAN